MKKKKHSVRLINHGVFPGETIVHINISPEEMIKKTKNKKWLFYYKNLVEENNGKNFCNMTDIDGETFSSIFIEKRNGTEEWYVILAHEVIHLVQFWSSKIGIDMVKEKEATAYFHSHVMRQILAK
jgi:hypothetical protein